MVVGFVATLFLQEIPLRKSRTAAHTAPAVEGLEDGGSLDEALADLADVGDDLAPVGVADDAPRPARARARVPAPLTAASCVVR